MEPVAPAIEQRRPSRDRAGRKRDRWRRCAHPCKTPSARSGRHRWSGRRRARNWGRRGGRARRRRGGWDCADPPGWRGSAGRPAVPGDAMSCRHRWTYTCRRQWIDLGAASLRQSPRRWCWGRRARWRWRRWNRWAGRRRWASRCGRSRRSSTRRRYSRRYRRRWAGPRCPRRRQCGRHGTGRFRASGARHNW